MIDQGTLIFVWSVVAFGWLMNAVACFISRGSSWNVRLCGGIACLIVFGETLEKVANLLSR